MLKYIISSFFILCCFTTKAQKNSIDLKKDSVAYYPKTYGLRIGADVIRPIYTFTKKDYRGLELVADYRLSSKFFIATELGYTQNTIEEDYFSNTIKGSYLKIGINYNLFKNWLNMDNEIYIGLRYATNLFSNQINNYTIFQKGEYFTPKTVNDPVKFNNINSHWLAFAMGIKVETFKNLFLGIMANVNRMMVANHPDNFKNNYSPGFGKISKNGTGANINYTVSYRIPLYKK